jgi:cation/acetate symporter
MLVNFTVSLIISRFTPPPPQEVQDMVEDIRIPSGAGEASGH